MLWSYLGHWNDFLLSENSERVRITKGQNDLGVLLGYGGTD